MALAKLQEALACRAAIAQVRSENQAELMGDNSLIEQSIGFLCLAAARLVPGRTTSAENDTKDESINQQTQLEG